MPYSKPDLLSLLNLTEPQLECRLRSIDAALGEGEYSEEKYHQLLDVCPLFDSGQVQEGDWQTAKELYATRKLVNSTKPNASNSSSGTSKNRKVQKNIPPANSNSHSTPQPPLVVENKQTNGDEANLSILDLINLAKQQLGLSLTLKQVVAVQEAAGLLDKPFYTQAEGNKFLITCRVLVQSENNNLNSRIQETTTTLETGLIDLIRVVTNERAKEVPEAVKQLYLQNVVTALAERQEDLEAFFMQIKNSIIAGVEGKSPLRSILEAQWITLPSLESGSLPIQSLPTSEAGTNITATSKSKPSDKL